MTHKQYSIKAILVKRHVCVNTHVHLYTVKKVIAFSRHKVHVSMTKDMLWDKEDKIENFIFRAILNCWLKNSNTILNGEADLRRDAWIRKSNFMLKAIYL